MRLTEFILDHKLLKYPNNMLLGFQQNQNMFNRSLYFWGRRTKILFKKQKNNIFLILICLKSTEAYVVCTCTAAACHLGQCMSFTTRQMLVCHLMDTVGITIELYNKLKKRYKKPRKQNKEAYFTFINCKVMSCYRPGSIQKHK